MTLAQMQSSKKLGKVLFFGRKDCNGTQKALTYLRRSGFDVDYVESSKKGEPMPDHVADWQGDYIFCFRSFYILRRDLLDRARIAAINFHPAPPEYPGSGCVNFALYENAREYGVTAHLMDEKVDSGSIIRCSRFPIFPGDNLGSLLERTHHALTSLFYEVLDGIVIGGEGYVTSSIQENAIENWSGEARKMKELDRLQEVSVAIDQQELDRIIRATHNRYFPVHTFIHGKKFVLDQD